MIPKQTVQSSNRSMKKLVLPFLAAALAASCSQPREVNSLSLPPQAYFERPVPRSSTIAAADMQKKKIPSGEQGPAKGESGIFSSIQAEIARENDDLEML